LDLSLDKAKRLERSAQEAIQKYRMDEQTSELVAILYGSVQSYLGKRVISEEFRVLTGSR